MIAKAVNGYLAMPNGDWPYFLMIITLFKNEDLKNKYI
jgi:hypothetical protein